ncbi:MAG TPA: inositol monophosphatase family protein [Aggregatilineales bacterium]|nr:inositol monophosphatase family protein [Aggregatilineales bacterium]
MLSTVDLELALDIAESAARAAGALIRRAYRLPRHIEDKGVNDLVTDTDRVSETLIVRLLQTALPTCNIAGEEKGMRPTQPDAPLTWWIDPLDGTTNFVHGVPHFSVSIGAVDPQDNILAGVVYDPLFDECFRAGRGLGATCNGDPVHVSTRSRLSDSLAASGFPTDLRAEGNNTAEWSAFVPHCQGMSRMGSAALDLCYVAMGRFDLYWESGLATWDMLAGVAILQEAGGRVTRYGGEPLNIHQRGELVASNGLVHDEAMGVLASVRREGKGAR